jgi:GT2 family glycosyltransferase
MAGITIGITTRDRPAALRRCLDSIAGFVAAGADVIVFDDHSSVPVAQQLEGRLPASVRVIRDDRDVGYIAARNAIVTQATQELVLLLDDDAVLFDASAVERGMAVLGADAAVAAVAFAQAEADGRPWPQSMQPGRGVGATRVASYIGFAHLIRRSVFLDLGGYRADFVFYGEEKEYCLRLMEAGYAVVYLPDALVGHVIDRGGRDQRRYVRFVIRNDCLMSLYCEPWPLVVVGVPLRLLRFRQMASSLPGGDAEGMRWILGELRRALPAVRKQRRPVSWNTIREWRRLSRTVVPYRPAARSGTR